VSGGGQTPPHHERRSFYIFLFSPFVGSSASPEVETRLRSPCQYPPVYGFQRPSNPPVVFFVSRLKLATPHLTAFLVLPIFSTLNRGADFGPPLLLTPGSPASFLRRRPTLGFRADRRKSRHPLSHPDFGDPLSSYQVAGGAP